MVTTLDIRGSLYEPDPTAPEGRRRWVYQHTAPGLGNISNGGRFDRQRRRWVATPNPRTAAQIINRARLAAAVAAWQAMDDAARAPYRAAAVGHHRTGYQQFCHDYMRTIAPIVTVWDPTFTAWDPAATPWDTMTPWDAGLTNWDANASIWDVANPTPWDAGLTIWDAGTPMLWDSGATTWDREPGATWDSGATTWID